MDRRTRRGKREKKTPGQNNRALPNGRSDLDVVSLLFRAPIRRSNEAGLLGPASGESATGRPHHATAARRGRNTIDTRAVVRVRGVEGNGLPDVLRPVLARAGRVVRKERTHRAALVLGVRIEGDVAAEKGDEPTGVLI